MTATPPGSLGLPLLGETLPFLKDPFEFELVRARKHGPVWETRILGSTLVYYAGPEDLEFNGFGIKRGWKAAGAIWPTSQDSTIFPDPTQFDPGRLDDTRMSALADDAYVPQGGGTAEQHRCAGEGFTDLIMPLYLAMLLRGYEVELPDQDLIPGAGAWGHCRRTACEQP